MFQKKEVKRIRPSINIIAAVTICLIFVIVVGIYPQLLLGLASAAASALGHCTTIPNQLFDEKPLYYHARPVHVPVFPQKSIETKDFREFYHHIHSPPSNY